MENYEQKHKEDLEAAKGWLAIAKENNNTIAIQILENLFPELKESEDEKIRNFLIDFIKKCKWTEKEDQGWPSKNVCISWLENKGEYNPTDKVEPKFNVGDWIINNDKRIAFPTQILKMEEYGLVTSRGYTSFNKLKTDYHLWTIQDANDGDVLKEDSCTFIIERMKPDGTAIVRCCLFDDGDFDLMGSTLSFDVDSTYPATKEQCDLLFQKMKEAGYEWDTEHKQLRKIEQNHTWSEEDEEILQDLIGYFSDDLCLSHSDDSVSSWLKSLKDRVQPQPKQEWTEEDERHRKRFVERLEDIRKSKEDDIDVASVILSEINWIKSINPQNRWKPSEYDISLLEEIARNIRNNVRPFCSEVSALEDLINDLKKL